MYELMKIYRVQTFNKTLHPKICSFNYTWAFIYDWKFYHDPIVGWLLFFSLWTKYCVCSSHSLKPLFFLSFYSLLSDDLLITEKLETIKCEFLHIIAHKYTKLATVSHIILLFFSKQDGEHISPNQMWPLVVPYIQRSSIYLEWFK